MPPSYFFSSDFSSYFSSFFSILSALSSVGLPSSLFISARAEWIASCRSSSSYFILFLPSILVTSIVLPLYSNTVLEFKASVARFSASALVFLASASVNSPFISGFLSDDSDSSYLICAYISIGYPFFFLESYSAWASLILSSINLSPSS